MTALLAISTVAGAAGLSAFAVLYALSAKTCSKLTIKVGDLSRDLAIAGGELRASGEQKQRLALTVARQSREIRELRSEIEQWAHNLPIAAVDSIRARLDRMLSPPDGDGDGASEVPGAAAGAADEPDPAGPVPDWID